jgi:hypothetical protein
MKQGTEAVQQRERQLIYGFILLLATSLTRRATLYFEQTTTVQKRSELSE